MKLMRVFVFFIMLFIIVGGVSAEENIDSEINYNILEIGLQSFYDDFINHLSYILDSVLMFLFSGNESQIGVESWTESQIGYGSASASGWGISDVEGDNPKELEKRFNNGENVENLTNISSMNDSEIENYVTKLATSKGYEISDNSSKINSFKIWYAISNTESLDNIIQILIQNKTGKVVIYKL
jgi:hypothetical protein